jgi:hydroxymethylglutaryl-CoA lyase
VVIQHSKKIKILETPRDAMQGLHKIIPTSNKVKLINALLRVGFDIIDIGSFVSKSSVPQMSDTADVLNQIDLADTSSKILVLVVNQKGAEFAAGFEQIHFIGYPFSTSPVFLKRNINSDTDNAWKTINEIQNTSIRANKHFLVYLSMAFGNPYGDPDGIQLIYHWTEKLQGIGIKTINLSDITGVATPESIEKIYSMLTGNFPDIEFGIHLHINQDDGYRKIEAAHKNGCIIFDGVINGMGGCPMTGYELLGNLPTSTIIDFSIKNNIQINIARHRFSNAIVLANEILS